MKNAYLIITDLHKIIASKSHRLDYVKEIESIEQDIFKVADRYKSLGYNVIALSLGDLVDRSVSSVDAGLKIYSWFTTYLKHFSKFYSVVGNHEFTYYSANPFWYLMRTLESERIKTVRRRTGWQPKGYTQFIHVVDNLVDGEVEFIFNHHGTGIQVPSNDKISIGLFHQDIVFREILDDAKNKNLPIFELEEDVMKGKYNHVYLSDKCDYLRGYDHCFFGHNHSLYGRWQDDKLDLWYLGSLGRTKETEVNDGFLERDLPVVIVEDGKFIGIESNKIELPSREKVIDMESLKKSKLKKEMKITKNIDINNLLSKTPVTMALEVLVDDRFANYIVDSILKDNEDELITYFRNSLGGE